MKKKDFNRMTSKQKANIARRYGHLIEDSCSGQECERCPFFHGNYINLPDKVFRGRKLVCGKIYDLFLDEVKL